MMKRIIIVIALFSLVGGTSWGDPVALNVEDAVRIAVARNQALQSASATVRANEAKVVEAASPLFPNVGLFYNSNRAFNPLGPPFVTTVGTFRSFPYYLTTYKDGITLNQLLFDGQKTTSLVRQQKAIAQASRTDFWLTTQSTAFNAISGFYQLAINRKMVEVSQENLKDAEEHLKWAEARYKAGIVPRSDTIAARVPVATAKLNLTQAEQGAGVAEASLDRILALDVTTPIVLKEVNELAYPVTEKEAFATALKNRNEIKRAQSLVNSARAQLDAARAGYLPQINLVAAYGYTDYGANVVPGNLGYNFGVQANYNLFQGNLQSGQVGEAKALLDKSIADLDAARQDVFLNVRQAFLSFQSAQESVNQAEAALLSAAENLHAMEGEYQAGLVPILNLTDAQASHLQAETNALGAHLNYQIAVAQLLLAIGINLEDIHAVVGSH